MERPLRVGTGSEATFPALAQDEELLFLERVPVVLQLGERFARVGAAGLPTPQAVEDSPLIDVSKPPEFPLLHPTRGTGEGVIRFSKYVNSCKDETRYSLAVSAFLRRAFGFLQGVNAMDREIIVCENQLASSSLKHILFEILFRVFQVPGITFISDLVAPLYSCGIDTGLVVDVGYHSIRVQPTCRGVPLSCALKLANGGASAVMVQLRCLLRKAYPKEKHKLIDSISLRDLEDMMVKGLYVRYTIPARPPPDDYELRHHNGTEGDQKKRDISVQSYTRSIEFQSAENLTFNLSNNESLCLPASIRWKASEILFGTLSPEECAVDVESSIVDLILESLEECPIDTRRLCIQNILLCGGTAQLRGFTTRLALDLKGALLKHPKLSGLSCSAGFGVPPFSPSARQWTGASIHGTLDGRQIYTRDDFIAGEPMPDWTMHSLLSRPERETRDLMGDGVPVPLKDRIVHSATQHRIETARVSEEASLPSEQTAARTADDVKVPRLGLDRLNRRDSDTELANDDRPVIQKDR